MSPRTSLLILTALSGVLFFSNLGARDLWRPDEPRYAQVAREMLETGNYLTPHVNGRPYKEKPPLLFWLTAAVSTPFGDVTETTARLPLATAGVATVLMTFALGTRLFDRRRAFWSGIILATTPGFWWHARTGQIDLLLTVCMAGSLLSLWTWHEHRRTLWLAGFYGGMAAGFLAKGPPALIFPLLTAFAFYWRRPVDRAGLRLSIGLPIVALVIGLWYVPARLAASLEISDAAGGIVIEELIRQTFGRFAMGISHAKPPWHYLVSTPAYFLPWSVFLPWAAIRFWQRRRESDAMRFLWAWIVPAFLFFSISAGKRSLYLLPLYPAIATVLAVTILELSESASARVTRFVATGWACGALVAGGGAIAYGLAAVDGSRVVGFLLLGILGLLSALHTVWAIRRNDGRDFPRLMSGHFAAALFLTGVVIVPGMNSQRSVKQLCAPIRELSDRNTEYRLVCAEGMREEYIYYAHHLIEPLFDPDARYAVSPAPANPANLIEMVAAMRAATESLELPNSRMPTPEQVARLREAVESGAALGGIAEDEYARSLQQIRERLGWAFDRECEGGPAFLIVRDRDLRWIAGAFPGAARLVVVRDEIADEHRRFLLANAAGARLLAELAS